jgi:hypothetical protein
MPEETKARRAFDGAASSAPALMIFSETSSCRHTRPHPVKGKIGECRDRQVRWSDSLLDRALQDAEIPPREGVERFLFEAHQQKLFGIRFGSKTMPNT